MQLVSGDYDAFDIPKNSVVYDEPPYKDTKTYATSKGSDNSKFWNWAREISRDSVAIVSEYKAPKDRKYIAYFHLKNTMASKNTYETEEKLFMYIN